MKTLHILNALFDNHIPGGSKKGDRLDTRGIDPKELKMGAEDEMEHTTDPKKAEEIAIDHLTQPGNKHYYTRLKRCKL